MKPIQWLLKTSGLTELCQVTVNIFPFKQKILKILLNQRSKSPVLHVSMLERSSSKCTGAWQSPVHPKGFGHIRAVPSAESAAMPKLICLQYFAFRNLPDDIKGTGKHWSLLNAREIPAQQEQRGSLTCGSPNRELGLSTRPVQAFWQLELIDVAQRLL